MSETVLKAAREYLARRDRVSNPPGKFDSAGRFFAAETCDCCRGIRSPSRAFPYPEMLHARTAKHVAAVHGVDASEVRKAARTLEANR